MNYLRMAGLFIIGTLSITSLLPAYAAAPKNKATAKIEKQKMTVPQATFVELGSVNCIPCKAMQPVMKEIEQSYGDQVKVVFHDVWTAEGKPYGEQYKIRAIPTQVFLDKDGREFFRHMGFFSTEEIVKVLEKQGIKKPAAPGTIPTHTKSRTTAVEQGQVCK